MRTTTRFLITLVALITTTAGAWAQTTVEWNTNTWADGWTSDVKTHTVDGVTVTAGGSAVVKKSSSTDNLYIYVTNDAANTLTFSADTPITRIEMTKATASNRLDVSPLDGWSVSSDGTTVTWEGTATKSLVCETCTLTVSKIKFYLAATTGTPLEQQADGKWTLDEFPAYTAKLNIQYEALPTITLPATLTGGTLACTVEGNAQTYAEAGQTVTLTATPQDGYMLKSLTVSGGGSVTWDADTWADWSWSNVARTADDITVTPDGCYFGKNSSGNLSLYHTSGTDIISSEKQFSRIAMHCTGSYFNMTNPEEYGWTLDDENKIATWEGLSNSVSLPVCTLTVSRIDFVYAVPAIELNEATAAEGSKAYTFLMPEADVTVEAEFEAAPMAIYAVTATGDEDGEATVTAKTADGQDVEVGTTLHDAAKGKTVTVTITPKPGYRVKSVKAVKGTGDTADEPAGIKATTEDIGKLIGADGNIYDDKAAAEAAGTTAVAMIAYVNGSNGLAIQLNSIPVEKNWADAKTYAEGLNTSTPIAGGTWRLPSKEDWQNMFLGCAVSGDVSASDSMNPIAGFKEKIAATGITWKSDAYWSSTPSGSSAWYVYVSLGGSDAGADFYELDTSIPCSVLGCLAF